MKRKISIFVLIVALGLVSCGGKAVDTKITFYDSSKGICSFYDNAVTSYNIQNINPAFYIDDNTLIGYKSDGSQNKIVRITISTNTVEPLVDVKEIHSRIIYNPGLNAFYYVDYSKLYKYDLTSSNVIELSDCNIKANSSFDSFYVSEDEQRIIYLKQEKSSFNIVLKILSDGTEELLADNSCQFTMSEDGMHLVYQKSGSENFTIYVLNLNNNTIESKIKCNTSSSGLAISDNGDKIVYTSHESGWFYENGKDLIHVFDANNNEDYVVYKSESSATIKILHCK